jgi:hypothetical protein
MSPCSPSVPREPCPTYMTGSLSVTTLLACNSTPPRFPAYQAEQPQFTPRPPCAEGQKRWLSYTGNDLQPDERWGLSRHAVMKTLRHHLGNRQLVVAAGRNAEGVAVPKGWRFPHPLKSDTLVRGSVCLLLFSEYAPPQHHQRQPTKNQHRFYPTPPRRQPLLPETVYFPWRANLW